ncbi:MAG: hypothetical protein ACHQPI_02955 [Thermoanaerobaculia bacterium]
MNRLELHPPQASAGKVVFRWTTSPRSPLYRTNGFTMRFPAEIDVTRLPDALLLTAFLECVHAHFPLLAPLEVTIPAALGPGEAEFWRRLSEVEAETLDALRGAGLASHPVRILEKGSPLSLVPERSDGRCAAAFSGGRDSLVQAGLLAELSDRPLLVACTSGLPPLVDHLTARRRQVFAETPRRLAVDLVDVRSDARLSFENRFAERAGYPVAVNELSDTHVYGAALLLAGWAHGASRFFLASEADVQESVVQAGVTVQHPHLMYAASTQRALSALVSRWGLSLGSLMWPLPGALVQDLLVKRFPHLADLQYSCWRVGPGEAACNRCSKCRNAAFGILAAGGDPGRAGFDLVRILLAQRGFSARRIGANGRPPHPGELVGRAHDEAAVRALRNIRFRDLAAAFGRGPSRAHSLRARALAAYSFRRLRRRTLQEAIALNPGYWKAAVGWIDPRLRSPLERIYAESFPFDESPRTVTLVARSEALTRRITEPLPAAIRTTAAP